MSKITLFFSVAFFITLVSCDPLPQEPQLSEVNEVTKKTVTKAEDIAYRLGSVIHYYANGNIKNGILGRDQEIQGPIYGLTYAANKYVTFYETGEFKGGYLVRVQELQGKIYGVTYTTNEYVTFYPTGELGSGYLAFDQTLQVGVNRVSFNASIDPAYSGISDDRTIFYKTGELKSGTLASNQTLQGRQNRISFDSNTGISFHKNGEVSLGYLTSDQDLVVGGINNNKSFRGGKMTFHETGVVKFGRLARRQPLQAGQNSIYFGGVYSQVGIRFHENGSVSGGILSENKRIENIFYFYNDVLRFDDRGSVEATGDILDGIRLFDDD